MEMLGLKLFILWMTTVAAAVNMVDQVKSCPMYAPYYCSCSKYHASEIQPMKMCLFQDLKGLTCQPCPIFLQDLINCTACPEKPCSVCSAHIAEPGDFSENFEFHSSTKLVTEAKLSTITNDNAGKEKDVREAAEDFFTFASSIKPGNLDRAVVEENSRLVTQNIFETEDMVTSDKQNDSRLAEGPSSSVTLRMEEDLAKDEEMAAHEMYLNEKMKREGTWPDGWNRPDPYDFPNQQRLPNQWRHPIQGNLPNHGRLPFNFPDQTRFSHVRHRRGLSHDDFRKHVDHARNSNVTEQTSSNSAQISPSRRFELLTKKPNQLSSSPMDNQQKTGEGSKTGTQKPLYKGGAFSTVSVNDKEETTEYITISYGDSNARDSQFFLLTSNTSLNLSSSNLNKSERAFEYPIKEVRETSETQDVGSKLSTTNSTEENIFFTGSFKQGDENARNNSGNLDPTDTFYGEDSDESEESVSVEHSDKHSEKPSYVREALETDNNTQTASDEGRLKTSSEREPIERGQFRKGIFGILLVHSGKNFSTDEIHKSISGRNDDQTVSDDSKLETSSGREPINHGQLKKIMFGGLLIPSGKNFSADEIHKSISGRNDDTGMTQERQSDTKRKIPYEEFGPVEQNGTNSGETVYVPEALLTDQTVSDDSKLETSSSEEAVKYERFRKIISEASLANLGKNFSSSEEINKSVSEHKDEPSNEQLQIQEKPLPLEYKENNETAVHFTIRDPDTRFRFKRSSNGVPLQNDWCTIKSMTRHANIECTVWTHKKECDLTCHEGYKFDGKQNVKLKCKRKENCWSPKFEACKGSPPKRKPTEPTTTEPTTTEPTTAEPAKKPKPGSGKDCSTTTPHPGCGDDDERTPQPTPEPPPRKPKPGSGKKCPTTPPPECDEERTPQPTPEKPKPGSGKKCSTTPPPECDEEEEEYEEGEYEYAGDEYDDKR